jgi:transcriptional regulator with GAF, ATPase, and Fis domain
MIANEDRRRPPLNMMPVPDSESDLHAILHSVSRLLAEIIGCNCVALLLLNEDERSARLYVLDVVAKNSPVARDVAIDHAVIAGLVNGRKPRYIPNLSSDPAAFHDLFQFTRFEPLSGAHVFPVSNAQERPGILVFVTNGAESCCARNLELMTSATVLISKFLDTALAYAAAESYKHTLARERDL